MAFFGLLFYKVRNMRVWRRNFPGNPIYHTTLGENPSGNLLREREERGREGGREGGKYERYSEIWVAKMGV